MSTAARVRSWALWIAAECACLHRTSDTLEATAAVLRLAACCAVCILHMSARKRSARMLLTRP